ncbi:MAG: endolytic transglycosylase MltG [Pseudomonadales bacterium]|nr:endolytic transglycosylase MltG [Pseudomonadales bacterium]
MKNLFWKLIVLIMVALLSASVVLAYLFDRAISEPMNVGVKGTTVVVNRGSTIGSVAHKLAQQEIIEYTQPLVWYVRLTGQANLIQAGEYRLPQGINPVEFVKMLVVGNVIQLPVTLIEGWTFKDIRAALSRAPQLRSETSDMTAQQIMAAIGMNGISPEGRFYPDTYLYTASTTDMDLLMSASAQMQQVLASAWQRREQGLPYATADEALVMASIIEKETGSAGERAEIAGVFVRRLKLGMRLQSDPTVIFGMGEQYKGNIRRSDLKRTTPYNTYRIKALPPGPIAIPGKASIEAALHPAEGNALYFVGKGDGSHHFSATLAEHQKAVEKYQRSGRRKDYRSHPTRAAGK